MVGLGVGCIVIVGDAEGRRVEVGPNVAVGDEVGGIVGRMFLALGAIAPAGHARK